MMLSFIVIYYSLCDDSALLTIVFAVTVLLMSAM